MKIGGVSNAACSGARGRRHGTTCPHVSTQGAVKHRRNEVCATVEFGGGVDELRQYFRFDRRHVEELEPCRDVAERNLWARHRRREGSNERTLLERDQPLNIHDRGKAFEQRNRDDRPLLGLCPRPQMNDQRTLVVRNDEPELPQEIQESRVSLRAHELTVPLGDRCECFHARRITREHDRALPQTEFEVALPRGLEHRSPKELQIHEVVHRSVQRQAVRLARADARRRVLRDEDHAFLDGELGSRLRKYVRQPLAKGGDLLQCPFLLTSVATLSRFSSFVNRGTLLPCLVHLIL